MVVLLWIIAVFVIAVAVNYVSGEYKQTGDTYRFCRRCGRGRTFKRTTVSHNRYDSIGGLVSTPLSTLLDAEVGHNTRELRCSKCGARP